jgi:hypothetical protein
MLKTKLLLTDPIKRQWSVHLPEKKKENVQNYAFAKQSYTVDTHQYNIKDILHNSISGHAKLCFHFLKNALK